MGKPTNTRSTGCAVTTSNCVVWQGPDLCCINVCHGDTVSDVIYAIAKKLCVIFELLDVKSYDLSELIGKDCPPGNFVEMIQLLIDAASQTTTVSNTSVTSGCPECEMTIATCFQREGNNTMQMTEYITAMGVKICEQNVTIQTQNNAILQLTQQIAAIQAQLNLLVG
jgi:hypothetical protein